jgi:hypothetical protein
VFNDFDVAANQVSTLLPPGPRIVAIGSTSFWHPESETLCRLLGTELAAIPDLTLITGGVPGVGEAMGRSFAATRASAGQAIGVVHVLPQDCPSWDYGTTLFAGLDMGQRREVLGRLAGVYLAVEGGPGTEHEARVALQRSAVVIPLARSGGHAAALYARLLPPPSLPPGAWQALESRDRPLEDAARAAVSIAKSLLARADSA